MSTEDDIELELQPDNDGKGDAKTDESIQVHQHEATGFRVSVRRIHQIHGFLKGDDTSPASLLVLKFVLTDPDNDDDRRRFRRFYVELRFAKQPSGEPFEDPYVQAFQPAGGGDAIYLSESLADVTKTKTNGFKFQAKAPPPADLGAEYDFSNTDTMGFKRKFLYVVQADWKSSMPVGRGRKGQDMAYWNLRENSREKVGVGSSMTIAVLVVRKKPRGDSKQDKFSMRVDIKATVDWKYKIATFAGKNGTTLDFDPEAPPDAAPEKVDRLRLSEIEDNGVLLGLSALPRNPSAKVEDDKENIEAVPQNAGAAENAPEKPQGNIAPPQDTTRRTIPMNELPPWIWMILGALILYVLRDVLQALGGLKAK